MRHFLILSALLGAMAFAAKQAEAQRGPFGGGTFGNPGGFGLLMNKGVLEELKLNEEQKTKIEEKRKEMGSQMLESRGKLKDLPKEEQQEKLQQVFKEIQEAGQKAIGEILKPEQAKRLKQIERQQNVARTLTNDEDAKKELKLTDDQSAKIKTISEESTKEIGQLRTGFKANPTETQEKIAALTKETNTKAIGVFTDDQKKTWKEMIGEPFEVKFEDFGNFGKKKKDDN